MLSVLNIRLWNLKRSGVLLYKVDVKVGSEELFNQELGQLCANVAKLAFGFEILILVYAPLVLHVVPHLISKFLLYWDAFVELCKHLEHAL